MKLYGLTIFFAICSGPTHTSNLMITLTTCALRYEYSKCGLPSNKLQVHAHMHVCKVHVYVYTDTCKSCRLSISKYMVLVYSTLDTLSGVKVIDQWR